MIPEEYLRHLPQLLKQLEKKMSGSSVLPDKRTTQRAGKHASAWHPDPALLDEELRNLVDRLSRHYPFHQPFYAGQMLKPPHPAAWLAYALAMTINPNNHALDGGPEASFMEKEVIRRLMHMVRFSEQGLGHLTSSGTIANLEALWVARELHPDRPFAVSAQAHYTHQRMAQVLRHPIMVLPGDEDGLPDPSRLSSDGPLPGTVVVTMGTTGTGRVEPLHRILPWARKNGVRIHVDAAYGGFFHLLRGSGLLDSGPWEVLSDVDSIVIDPHKHGLQPYGCGAVLFRDPAVGKLYRHDSPYTYFTSDELHLGEISLECSRAGAAAVALWFTLKLLLPESEETGPPSAGLPRILADCRNAALRLYDELKLSDRFQPVMKPELDIVTYVPVTGEATFSSVSRVSEEILKRGMDADPGWHSDPGLHTDPGLYTDPDLHTDPGLHTDPDLHTDPGMETDSGMGKDSLYLSTLTLSEEEAARWLPGLTADTDRVRVLRSVLMKPEHLQAVPDIMRRLHKLHRGAVPD